MKKYTFLLALIGAMSSIFGQQDSLNYVDKYYMPVVKDMTDFEAVLDQYPYVVAYVYTLTQQDKELLPKTGAVELLAQQAAPARTADKVSSARYDEVNRIFDLIQRYPKKRDRQYNDVGVKFIGVNLATDDLQALRETYNLAADKDYLIFFKDGAVMLKQVVRAGFDRANFDAFIDRTNLEDYVAQELKKLVRQARPEKKSRRVVRKRYYACDNGPYVGIGLNYEQCWYGPGWRPYYWGPSYWGYTYPYRGYYYAGPQFGVSFSV